LSWDADKVYDALVLMAVEKALLDVGKAMYDIVIERLGRKYDCGLSDCYLHPEYLNSVLKELGDVRNEIVKSINEQLMEFTTKGSIAKFLQVITK
jgi:hypothetical protein